MAIQLSLDCPIGANLQNFRDNNLSTESSNYLYIITIRKVYNYNYLKEKKRLVHMHLYCTSL